MKDDERDSALPDDEFRFIDEGVAMAKLTTPWKVIIADDDHDVHLTTKLVLGDFEFRGRRLEFLDAYDGAAACDLVRAHPDAAILLLDVVMESTDAGLNAVRRIREEIGNRMLRIILRTGQPGHAPEREVVLKYHINDYKSKLELTTDKLFTSLVSALRSYEDLQAIEAHRAGLVKVLDAASRMDFRSQNLFASGLMTQLGTLLGIGREDLLLLIRRRHEDGCDVVMAAVGNREPQIGARIVDVLDSESAHFLTKTLSSGVSHVDAKRSIFVVPLPDLVDVAVYIGGPRRIEDSEMTLIRQFCIKVVLAYQNFEFVEHSRLDQYAEIALLAMVAGRAPFLGIPYVASYGRLSRLIAQHMDDSGSLRTAHVRFAELLERAAMFADIGNDGLPAGLLEKPSALTDYERAAMRMHPERGHRLLQEIHSWVPVGRVIGLAREVVLTHHERFDGTGYPAGIKGRNIPVSGRIVALANSYTALISARPWRPAYGRDEAQAMIESESGLAFDPEVVAAFVAVADAFRQNRPLS